MSFFTVGKSCVATSAMVALTLLAVGCSSSEQPATTEGGLTKVDLGVNPISDAAPIWIAQKEGFFAKHGLDVTIETGAGGAALIPGVISGEFDFTFANPTTLYVALEQGLPLQVVSGLVASTGVAGEDGGAILVPTSSDIEGPADLAGKSLAVNTLNSIVSTVSREAVREAGENPDDVNLVEIAFPDMLGQLESGNIDAAFLVEPFISSAIDGGEFKAISWPYVVTAPELPVGIALASKETVADHPDIVEGFRAALAEAVEYANENPDMAREIVTTYMPLKADQVAGIYLPKWTTEINREGAEKLAELMVEDGTIETEPDLDAILP